MQFPNLKIEYAGHFIVAAVLLQSTTSAPRKPRLSIADWGEAYHKHEPEGKGTYAFGYDIDDPETGNTQYRDEQRHANGSVTGSYGLLEPDGNVRVVHYIADEKGFRVNIINSQKPNAEFPAPTAPLLPSQLEDGNTEVSQPPSELPDSPTEQPELIMEIPQQPSQPVEEATELEEDTNQNSNTTGGAVSSPPNTIVIPGGFVIEIPPDDPEDDRLGPHHKVASNDEVDPTYSAEDPPSILKYGTHGNSQFGPVLFHPQPLNSYYQYSQHPFSNYYLPPTYNPYYSFVPTSSYYNNIYK